MLKEYKTIREIVGPLMLVEGVEGVKYNEMVEIVAADGAIRRGKVLEINRDKALVQLFEPSQGIQMSSSKDFWARAWNLRCPKICSAVSSTVSAIPVTVARPLSPKTDLT